MISVKTPLPLDRIRESIRSGRLAETRARLREATRRKMTRSDRLALANIANEISLWPLALRLLARTVDPKNLALTRASDEEKGEYARALIGIGATNEGLNILRELDVTKYPRFLYFRTLAHFRRWDWLAALAAIQTGLARKNLTKQERLYLSMDLGCATLHGKRDIAEARRIFTSLAEETSPTNFRRIHWDSWQLIAQTYYLEKDFPAALRCHDRLENLYDKYPGDYFAGVSGAWRALMDLHNPSKRTEACRRLDEKRELFMSLHHWEHVRMYDYYRCIATQDRELMLKLYFGTPHTEFKKRLLREFRLEESQLPLQFVFELGIPALHTVTFDVANGRFSNGARLKPYQAQHRLLLALATELYRPQAASQLFEQIHTGQYFNPLSGVVRIRQLVKRLRQWMARNEIPMQIKEEGGRYSLVSAGGMRLLYSKPADIAPAQVKNIELLKDLMPKIEASFGNHVFRAREVEALLDISRMSALRILRAGIERNLIEKVDSSTSSAYRVVRPNVAVLKSAA